MSLWDLRVRDGEMYVCMLYVCRPERGDPVWRWEVWDARSLVSDLLTAEMGPAQRSSLTSEEYSGVIV